MTKTTAEQRKAWAEVHKALANYIENFGPIEIGEEDGFFVFDDFSLFVECGKIYCPDHRFSLDKRKFPWYNWCRKKR